MDNVRFRKLNILLNQNWNERHDIPQMHFTHLDLKWLMEQAEKVERYEKALKEIASRKGDFYEDEVASIAEEAINS